MKPPPDPVTLSKRASQVVLATLLMVAVSGYFMGLNQTRGTHAPRAASATGLNSDSGVEPAGETAHRTASARDSGASASVPSIVAYSQLGEAAIRPNAHWNSSLASLVPPPAAVAPSRTPAEAAAERARAVERRRSRRAFEGAPPVIPHPVDPTSPASCRACHENGLAIRDLVAPRMSHGSLGLCTQCHVPSGGGGPPPDFGMASVGTGNAFEGLRSPGSGSRAWPGAPPTIPHTLQLRESCASCHGPHGLPGLRTSHPERTLCTQCHVPEPGGSVFPWTPPAPAQLTLR